MIKEVIIYSFLEGALSTSTTTITLVPAEDESFDELTLARLRSKCEELLNQSRFQRVKHEWWKYLEHLGSSYLVAPHDAPSLLTVLGSCFGALTTAAGTGLGAWIQARNGRKVRIKVGDIEVEANTAEEVERLLARAQKIKVASKPKRIHGR